MRDFFIQSFERLVSIIVLLMAIGFALGGLAVMFQDDGGIVAAIFVWIAGALYVTLMGGMLYLVLGIHANTKRTAEAVEALAGR